MSTRPSSSPGSWGGTEASRAYRTSWSGTRSSSRRRPLFAVEFVADKIPYVDNVWDAVHTAIRPTLAAVLGALLAGEANDLGEAVAAVLGGTTALASHAAKASLRLAVNASPEPVSNIVLSLAEDSVVVAVLLLAVDHPWWALAAAFVLLVGAASLGLFLIRRIRQFGQGLRGPPAPEPPPGRL
jgi:hypothetical protein